MLDQSRALPKPLLQDEGPFRVRRNGIVLAVLCLSLAVLLSIHHKFVPPSAPTINMQTGEKDPPGPESIKVDYSEEREKTWYERFFKELFGFHFREGHRCMDNKPIRIIKTLAAQLKKQGNMPRQPWSEWAKNDMTKEYEPVDFENFCYIRTAAALLRLYKYGDGVVSIHKFKKMYQGTSWKWGQKKGGGWIKRQSSGVIWKTIVKQLKETGMVEVVEDGFNGGLKLSPKGRSDMDRIFVQCAIQNKHSKWNHPEAQKIGEDFMGGPGLHPDLFVNPLGYRFGEDMIDKSRWNIPIPLPPDFDRTSYPIDDLPDKAFLPPMKVTGEILGYWDQDGKFHRMSDETTPEPTTEASEEPQEAATEAMGRINIQATEEAAPEEAAPA